VEEDGRAKQEGRASARWRTGECEVVEDDLRDGREEPEEDEGRGHTLPYRSTGWTIGTLFCTSSKQKGEVHG
jgi:hypothetical protein